MINAIHINDADNVVVAIEDIKKGDMVEYVVDEEKKSFEALDDVRIYHKVAKVEIEKDEHVIKYGEHIGLASDDIKIGEHVHTHNVTDSRENLEI